MEEEMEGEDLMETMERLVNKGITAVPSKRY